MKKIHLLILIILAIFFIKSYELFNLENISIKLPLPKNTEFNKYEYKLSDEFLIQPEILDNENIEIEEKIYIDNKNQGGEFELPLKGASGFAGTKIPVKEDKDIQSSTIKTLSSGDGFQILQEQGDWWEILTENTTGWVEYKNCLINLPDLIPSIIYENPYASVCCSKSLGRDIPNVTGEKLYDALFYNQRFDKEVYISPVLYSTAKKINIVQQQALADGNTLLFYEGYRPHSVQQQLVTGLSTLMSQDSEVNKALTSKPWGKSWFVSTGLSNHQKGQAVDISLLKIEDSEILTTGDYEYLIVTNYSYLEMPTEFDELSPLSAIFPYPVTTTGTNWKNVTPSNTMTASALLLQSYCSQAGLTPLSSEWWHFNDVTNHGNNFIGDFTINQCYSVPPMHS